MSEYTEDDMLSDEGVQADVCSLLDEASNLYQQATDKLTKAQKLHSKAKDPELVKAIRDIDTSSPDYAEHDEAHIGSIDLWDKLPPEGEDES